VPPPCAVAFITAAARFQTEGGYPDSAKDMYRYLKQEIGDAVQDSTLRQFCNDSNANLEWLTSHGVNFGSKVYTGKRSYPPAGYDLYFSGNEKVPRYKAHAKAAPRGHRVVGPDFTGETLFAALKQSAFAHGVRLRPHTRVTRLLLDSASNVVGVEVQEVPTGSVGRNLHRKLIRSVNKWRRLFEPLALKAVEQAAAIEQAHARPLRIRARRGVVLSTGSFAFNRPMVRQYAPKFAEAMPHGTLGCDGSGIRLGQSVGGATGYMHSVTAWRSISPPEAFVESIVVNKDGRRFVNEDAYLGHLGFHIAEQPGGRAWVIVDRNSWRRSFRDTVPTQEKWHYFGLPLLINLLSAKKGRTLAQLAQRIGVNADNLSRTVLRYNADVAQGQDEFGKLSALQRAVGDGPYYAIDISTGCKANPNTSIPMGGLEVNETSGQVLRTDGSAVNGLFAAGRTAKGIPAGFYVSGLSVADCVFSGRRAGLHAATRETRRNQQAVEKLSAE